MPDPVMRMVCARNAPVPSQVGFLSTSSSVNVNWKLPLMSAYAPVHEPAPIGATAETTTEPEHLPASVGNRRLNASANAVWMFAILMRNVPRASANLS